jgi:hypothetical protein
MQPVFIFVIFIIPFIAIVSGIVKNSVDWIDPIMAVWIGIGTILTISILMVLTNRHQLCRAVCFPKYSGFFSRSDYNILRREVWVDSWASYTCTIDDRLMNTKHYVYYIFVVFVATMLGVFICIILNTQHEHKNVIIIQVASICVYVVTLIVEYIRKHTSHV